MIPLHDWMIIEAYHATKQSIVLPDQAREKIDNSTAFKVLKRGPGFKLGNEFFDFPQIQVGSIIILEGMNTPDFTYANKYYRCAQMRNVAFIAEESDLEGGVDD